MRTIQSRSHPYTVEDYPTLADAIGSLERPDQAHFLVDRVLVDRVREACGERLQDSRLVSLEASEHAKSYGPLEQVFLDLLERNLKRSGTLVVIGGGVMQDAGCFIASVLSRGIRWVYIPTTLLAQADSCIGSKSSINIGAYKNQIGTFYPPHRVLLVPEVLRTLPYDELRSGLGEVIKLQLLASEAGFEELMRDLEGFERLLVEDRERLLATWVRRSMDVKQPVIEADEFDRGQRLLLNYGHTFGHAYESTTAYGIPHGIAVILGMLTATVLSARLNMVPAAHAERLLSVLQLWHEPYAGRLAAVGREQLLEALAKDKKNAATGLTCILTRGYAAMERITLAPEQVSGLVWPTIRGLIDSGFSAAIMKSDFRAGIGSSSV
ncbi:MAG: 3-dehydroquinate synthase [Planctomycetia bacterium]